MSGHWVRVYVMKTLLDVLVENHEMYCLSFRCVLVNKSFIFNV